MEGLQGGRDEAMMRRALAQAAIAASLGEVPVGAVIARGDTVIAEACNRREADKSALAHAELLAIDAACRQLGGWRLHMCELYVTLEPCPMCAGAIVNSRIRRVVFGARDPKAGCYGSLCDFADLPFNHRPEITAGLLERECGDILRDFFARLRQRRKLGE